MIADVVEKVISAVESFFSKSYAHSFILEKNGFSLFVVGGC
jgi:hypothetical protein